MPETELEKISAEIAERDICSEAVGDWDASLKPATVFYARLQRYASDIDFEELLKENRRPHRGIDLLDKNH